MTLIFDKNGERDTRLIDYEQAIVQAGLAKAAAENEVERAEKKLIELGEVHADVLRSIEAGKKDVQRLEDRYFEVKKEIQEAVLKGAEESAAVQGELQKSEGVAEEKKSELEKLNAYLVSVGEEIETKNKEIAGLREAATGARDELARVQSELSQAASELGELKSDIQSLYKLKIEVASKLTSIDVERQEVEEIVKTLKEKNKEGLELVASFDGERKRLQEKEEFLKRKEADLLIYENRLKKHCAKVGYNVEMVFK